VNAAAETEPVELFAGDDFSPIQDAMADCSTQVVVGCCGRRVGKTWLGARITLSWVFDDLEKVADRIDAGEEERWIGESLKPVVAKEVAPHVLYYVVAPRDDHLQQIRGYMMEVLERNGGAFRHPLFSAWFSDRNRRLWLWMDGACGRIDFIPCTSPTSMVSRGLHGVWVDEAGFVPNERFQALKPSLWEHGGRLLATGTPSLGSDHWFTKLGVSGLPEGHERADHDISPPDERVTTFIASTVEHAFVAQARSEAAIDAEFWGAIWAAQWVHADWRQRSREIFREWDHRYHVRELKKHTGIPVIGQRPVHHIGRQPWAFLGQHPIYTEPSATYGVVDWSGGVAPGAAIIARVWRQNPVDKNDPRPLVHISEDYQGHEAYTSDGWWRILTNMDQSWGVDRWLGDPHAPRLIKAAKRAGIPIQEGAHQDKMGRINLVAALLHHDQSKHINPALYISPTAEHTARELSGYKWGTTRDGRIKDKPMDRDDHCVDCLAMLAAEVYTGGGIQIGHERYS